MADIICFGEIMLRLAPPGIRPFSAGGFFPGGIWRK